MTVKETNVILERIFGKKFLSFLDFIADRIDEKLGKKHNVLIGISFLHCYKYIILELGIYLSLGYELEILEKEKYTDSYMSELLYNSLEEFYNTYKIYIEVVREYVMNIYNI